MAEIPKFGSFKKKSPKLAHDVPSEPTRSRSRHVTKSGGAPVDEVTVLATRHPGRLRDSSDTKHRSSHSGRSDRSTISSVGTAKAPIPKALEVEDSDAYLVDVRGDPQNVQYGSLHRANIPLHRRGGYGAIIGTSPLAYIDRDASTDRGLYFKASGWKAHKRASRPLTSKHNKPSESRYKVITPISSANDASEEDFIDLQPPQKRMRVSETLANNETVAAHPDYRSIEGKAKASLNIDEDLLELGSDSGSDDAEVALESSARQVNSSLLKIARADPLKVNLWLRLSTHQAQLIRPGLDTTLMTSSQRKSLADMRLAILDEASKHISTGHPDRAILLSAIIDETSSLLDASKTNAKWKKALQECPNDVNLFKKYLDHLQGEPQSFDFDNCKAQFIRALAIVKTAYTSAPSHDLLIQQVYLLARTISFVRDAGYNELATAIWQAVLEYRFFRPSQLRNADPHQAQEAFEEFWERDVPRIGEEGSTGWAEYVASGSNSQRAGTQVLYPALDRTNNLFASFAETEIMLSGFNMVPTSGDDDEPEDPFRSVMFKDFEQIVECLDDDLPEDATINAFLTSYSLPSMATQTRGGSDRAYLNDPYLTAYPLSPALGNASEEASISHSRAIRGHLQSTLGLFDGSFDSLSAGSKSGNKAEQDLYKFLDRCLESLVSALPGNDALAEYFLAWKLYAFPDTAKKVAKRLLKSRPSNLRLYNAFALLEAASGRLDQAKDVWSTALKMRTSLATDAQHDAILLWHSSLISLARNGDEQAALACVLGIEDEISNVELQAGPVGRQLRATQAVKGLFDRCMLAGDLSRATLYADSLAWLLYFTNDCEISKALASYKAMGDRIATDAGIGAGELLLQCKLALLRHHLARKRPFKPAVWVEELQRDLHRFPSNDLLLDLHAQISSRDRIRNIMREQQFTEPHRTTVVEWSFKISAEIRGMQVDGSGCNINTVRSMFSKALLHPESAVRQSPELWIMWLAFEYYHDCFSDPSVVAKPASLQHVKRVFLNGLQHLPWYKHWALLGMKHLGTGQMILSTDEMRRVYETMVERGLRISTNLDEYLQSQKGSLYSGESLGNPSGIPPI